MLELHCLYNIFIICILLICYNAYMLQRLYKMLLNILLANIDIFQDNTEK